MGVVYFYPIYGSIVGKSRICVIRFCILNYFGLFLNLFKVHVSEI